MDQNVLVDSLRVVELFSSSGGDGRRDNVGIPPTSSRLSGRIGRRVAQQGLVGTWRVQRQKRGRLSRGKVEWIDREAVIEDLSITGARVLILADPDDRVGEVIQFRIGQAWGPARVARQQKSDDPAVVAWGIEFLQVRGDFLNTLTSFLASGPG